MKALEDSHAGYDFPEIIKIEESDTGRLVHFSVPAGLSVFDDHFPGFSVVPGVSQLYWVFHFMAGLMPSAPYVLQDLKYMRPLLPGHAYELAVNFRHEFEFRFQIREDGELCTVGIIRFEGG